MRYSRFLTTILLFSLTLIFSTSVLAQKDDKHLIRARKLFDKKKYDEAVEAYKKSFQLNPNWKAAYGIGSDYLRLENPAEAIVYFRKALQLKKDEPMIWYSIGYSFGKMNENDEAVPALQKAVELKPDYTDAWYNLGSVLFKSGRYKEAVEAYETTTKLNPNDAEAYAFLGLAYSNLNNFNKAIESLQKAVKIAPNNDGYRQNLASQQVKLREQGQKAP
jgi:superkiller protein 3